MSVPIEVWPPLRRLPIALLVVLLGCRTAPPPSAPPPVPEPPPIDQTPPLDLVEQTRMHEESLETVWIELEPEPPGTATPVPAALENSSEGSGGDVEGVETANIPPGSL